MSRSITFHFETESQRDEFYRGLREFQGARGLPTGPGTEAAAMLGLCREWCAAGLTSKPPKAADRPIPAASAESRNSGDDPSGDGKSGDDKPGEGDKPGRK